MDSPARSPQRERQVSPQRERLPGQTRTAQLVDNIRHLAKVQKYAIWDTRYKEDTRRFVERALNAVKGETDTVRMATKIADALRAVAEEYRARAAAEKAQDMSHIDGVLSRSARLAEGREADVASKIKAAEERRAALDAQLVGLRRAIDAQVGRTSALDEKRKALRALRAKNALRRECLDRLDWSVALNEPVPRPLFSPSGSATSLSTSPPKGIATIKRQGSPSPDVLLATLRRAAAQPPRPASSNAATGEAPVAAPSSVSPRPSADGRSSPPPPPSAASTLHRPASPARVSTPQRSPSPLPPLRSSQNSQPGTLARPVSPSPSPAATLQRSASPQRSLLRSPSPQPAASGSTEEAPRLLYVQRGGSAPSGASLRGINAQWQPDAEAPQCRSCRARFTFTLRRHHCRLCGYIFCADCSSKRVRIPSMLLGPGALKGEALQEQRVCNKCYNAIMLQEPPA